MKSLPVRFDTRLKVTLLWSLTQLRLDDAQALFKTGLHGRRNGAIYLAGYAVECALKAKICEVAGNTVFDPNADIKLKIHGLRLLAERGGLLKMIQSNVAMMEQLTILDTSWSVTLRYQQRSINPEEVLRFLERAKDFTQWLRAR